MINEEASISCEVAGYPEPKVFWSYKGCLDDSCPFREVRGFRMEQRGLLIKSYFNITPIDSGIVSCYAVNELGDDNATAGLFVTGK